MFLWSFRYGVQWSFVQHGNWNGNSVHSFAVGVSDTCRSVVGADFLMKRG